MGRAKGTLALLLVLLTCFGVKAEQNSDSVATRWRLQCSAPTKGDPIIAYTQLYGQPNVSDSAWHDDSWAFVQYGPITEIEVYHSGNGWHDPFIGFHPGGEFKGIRPTYGGVTNNDTLLFGARKPHKPMNFTLAPGEMIVRVELQHDHVMRWMAFTTNYGHWYEWGFKDMPNTTYEVAYAPREGAYLAAFRGFEGKQLPPELGGYKKRYIIQVGFVWAMTRCTAYQWTPAPVPSTSAGRRRMESPAPEDPLAGMASYEDAPGSIPARPLAPLPRPSLPLGVPPAPPYPPVIGLHISPPPLMPPAPPPPPPRAGVGSAAAGATRLPLPAGGAIAESAARDRQAAGQQRLSAVARMLNALAQLSGSSRRRSQDQQQLQQRP